MPRTPPARVLWVALLACLSTGCGPGIEARVPAELPPPVASPSRPVGEPLQFSCVDRNVLRAARRIVPLTEYLERKLGRRVELAYFSDPENQLEALLAGRFELAWISPTDYVRARRKVGVTPLVRPVQEDHSTYRSVLVVPDASTATKVEDLVGQRVAFVRPGSTSGNVFPRAFLEARGLDPEKDFSKTGFTGSHFTSLFALQQGDYDAAFVEDGALRQARGELATRLRVLETVAVIPHGPIVAHPSLPAAEREAVAKAFLDYDTDPLNHDLLYGLMQGENGISGFKATEDEDYADVRRHFQEGQRRSD